MWNLMNKLAQLRALTAFPLGTFGLLQALICIVSLCFFSGCGVKGDPLPPERPPEIGRGKPTFQRATRNIQLPYDDYEDEEQSQEEEAE